MFHNNYFKGLIFFLTIVITGCNNTPSVEVKETSAVKVYYQESHRPQFHFSPEANWMNDPNGMFYYKGKYHLFYQYYPDSTVWGPMHWGHAASTDLVHWEHLPIALYPDSIGLIFSGGAVVDHLNTSKLGTATNPPIVASFTHHNMAGEKAGRKDFQHQSIAYSLDEGNEWIKYKDNPVIRNTEKIKDFRDPKVVWHEKSQQWILVIAAYDKAKFYASKNLIDWKFISDFGIEGDNRLWECPDLFPMKVEGSEEEKWVLIVSIQKEAPNGGTASSYFVGDFDGQKFKADSKNQKWLDWGTDNYAFVTWNNIPKEDGRTIGIGWMSNWQYAQILPTEKWRSAMTLPRELSLKKLASDYVLYSQPIKELQKIRGKNKSFNSLNINGKKALDYSFDPSQSETIMTVNLQETKANTFGIKLENEVGENVLIAFNKKNGILEVDRTNSNKKKFSKEFYNKVHTAPINLEKEELKIQLFIDAASLEIFINDGELNFTDIFFPSSKFNKISLFANDGKLDIEDATAYELKSIWD